MAGLMNEADPQVRCRIGSSEMHVRVRQDLRVVRCRIGSSENPSLSMRNWGMCSLPHRQLRKVKGTVHIMLNRPGFCGGCLV